jgi:hypothetical protein
MLRLSGKVPRLRAVCKLSYLTGRQGERGQALHTRVEIYPIPRAQEGVF